MRQINTAGLNLIKEFEGLRLHAYSDGGGYPTIGYGHKILEGEDLPDEITEEKATELLVRDLAIAETTVSDLIRVPLNDNQFAALVSLVYNTGPRPLTMGLGKSLNAGDYDQASQHIMFWNECNGHVCEGLERRRTAEKNLFNTSI